MGRAVYDVYDKDGNLIMEKMTSAGIGAALNESPVSIARCSNNGKLLKGRYGIVKSGKIKAGNPETEKLILAEWDKVITPFKRVIWVKEYSPGVKRLKA